MIFPQKNPNETWTHSPTYIVNSDFSGKILCKAPKLLMNDADTYCLVLYCLVLYYVLANTPMESNGQGWGAWSSLVEMC